MTMDDVHRHDQMLRETVLKQINTVRAWAAMDELTELPKGWQASMLDCPVGRGLKDTGTCGVSAGKIYLLDDVSVSAYANALGGSVKTYQFRGEEREYVEPPYEMAVFIANFDMGDYPDLVDP